MASRPEGYPIIYWVAIIGAFALLVADLAIKDDQAWASLGVMVCIAVAVFTRPGGLFKRR